jgi:hypothetical protein
MDVLLIDDWGLAPILDQERRDLLEILEDFVSSAASARRLPWWKARSAKLGDASGSHLPPGRPNGRTR